MTSGSGLPLLLRVAIVCEVCEVLVKAEELGY